MALMAAKAQEPRHPFDKCNILKAHGHPLSNTCDLVSVKLDFVHELFQSLCKRSNDNIWLTVAHHAIKVSQIYTES